MQDISNVKTVGLRIGLDSKLSVLWKSYALQRAKGSHDNLYEGAKDSIMSEFFGHKQRTDNKDCHRDCRICLLQDFEIGNRQQALEDEAQAFDLERLEFAEQVIYEMEHDL